MNDTNRIAYADVLRILAIFGMIIIHVIAGRWRETLGSTEWEILNIYHGLTTWCIPIFIMISGMLFLNPKKEITYGKLFKKYILRITVALIVWGLAYGIWGYREKLMTDFQFGYIFEIVSKIFFGPPWYHLWFLYIIIGLYLITPPLRLFTSVAKEKDVRYVLWLFFIFGIFVTVFNDFYPQKINLAIPEISAYAGYFIAGYYFSSFEISKTVKNFFYITGLLSIFFTIFITSFLSHLKGVPYDYFYNNHTPNIMLTSFGIFLLAKNLENNKSKITTFIYNNKYLVPLAGSCFGIYLVHDFFLQFQLLKIFNIVVTPIISTPILFLMVLGFSLAVTMIIKKIPILNKWII